MAEYKIVVVGGEVIRNNSVMLLILSHEGYIYLGRGTSTFQDENLTHDRWTHNVAAANYHNCDTRYAEKNGRMNCAYEYKAFFFSTCLQKEKNKERVEYR